MQSYKLIIIVPFLILFSYSSDSQSNKFSEISANIKLSPTPYLNEFDDGQGIDIIIIYGQSNAVGRGDFTYANTVNDYEFSNQKAQKCIIGDQIQFNAECIIFNSINNPSDLYLKGYYSAWTEFNRYLESISHREIILINAAWKQIKLKSLMSGATDILHENGIKEYENLIYASRKAIDKAGIKNINSVSVFWLQGESDVIGFEEHTISYFNKKFREYFSNLDRLYEDLLRDLGIPKLSFFIIRLGLAEDTQVDEFLNDLLSGLLNDLGFWQIEFCKSNENFFPLSLHPVTYSLANETLSDDGIHYTPYGYDLIGRDAAINFSNYIDKQDISLTLYQENDNYPPIVVKDQPF